MLMCGLLASAEINPMIVSSFKVNGLAVSLVGGGSQLLNQLPVFFLRWHWRGSEHSLF